MKIVVDVNLAPAGIPFLTAAGHEAIHWSNIGDVRAADSEIMTWARANGHAVLTHDLDFTTILALTRAVGPSVIQLRAQDTLPDAAGSALLRVLVGHGDALERGAVASVDEAAARVRILPLT